MQEAGFAAVELERCPHCRLRPIDDGGPAELRLAARRARESRLAKAARALRLLFRRSSDAD